MPEGNAERIVAVLSSASPLTVREIAAETGMAPDEVAEIVWSAPEGFHWQPGGRWTLAAPKAPVTVVGGSDYDDGRPAVLAPKDSVELRAIRLSTGETLRVVRRALDSAVPFTVKSEGADLQLILNAAHELFEQLPMPFEDGSGDFKSLVELLLAAWAIQEAQAPAAARRSLEDARMLWGRRLHDLLESTI